MCGIAGFSLTENSGVNARALSHHLLAQIEDRGQMAAGFAFGHEGKVGYHKDKVAGSNLRLKGLPRNAKTVILHTRFATHGTINDNSNNHPVLSPDNRIALVHNGVIWNHDTVRRSELSEFKLPEVDTSVIPAVIQKYGIEGVKHLSGDAAVAWLDSREPDVLNLARLESSPVAFTQLADGSIVFASIGYMLEDALALMGLTHGAILIMDELEYYQLKFGHIIKVDHSPEMQKYSTSERWWANSIRGGSGSKAYGTGSSKYSGSEYDWNDDDYFNGYDNATSGVPTTIGKPKSDIAMVFVDDTDGKDMENTEDLYYTVDQDGNFKSYRTLDSLENDLKWHAGIAEEHGDPMFGGEGLSRWMEYFLDVGSFGFGNDGSLLSWVDDPSEIAYHENHSNDGLSYIRDGVSILSKMTGM